MDRLTSLLKINQLVHIEIVRESNKPIRYSSRVENFDDHSLALVAPMKEREAIILAEGTALNIWFWNKEAIYVFRTFVLKNTLTSVQQIIVARPETIERVQNREYVRVNLVIEVLLSYFNPQGVEEVIRCTSKDVSGGGMMLVINTYVPLAKNAKIQVKFRLEQSVIKAEGEIVWNEWELDKHGIERNCIGIKFAQISEENRKTIIQSVYLRQIELKKKGLL